MYNLEQIQNDDVSLALKCEEEDLVIEPPYKTSATTIWSAFVLLDSNSFIIICVIKTFYTLKISQKNF